MTGETPSGSAAEPESGDFTGARAAGVEGLRIAVITEGTT